MRNLFDQYKQPENRLSHALAVCLHEDRALLRDFVRWIGLKPPDRTRELLITEQGLPGDLPESEEQAERNGLPDIVIHDDSAWCLIIESKVQAALSDDQLARHERTLRRRGFDSIACVALTKTGARSPRAVTRTWSGLYEWLGKSGARREWPERLRSYLRVAEVRLVQDEYLTEGTLTMFDGFQFSAESPYSYGEAKRLLRLAMAELRRDDSLKALGMDPTAKGRTAITGSSGGAVWDFLSLADRPSRGSFTSYPHLTLAAHDDHLEVAITVPNGVIGAVRRRLSALGAEGLVELNAKILRRAERILSLGGQVEAYAMQRHYVSQRSQATTDARMTFALQTSQPGGSGPVKRQPEWVGLFAELLREKRSNIQFGYWMLLPWETEGLDSRESLRLVAESWCAMEPLLDKVRGKS